VLTVLAKHHCPERGVRPSTSRSGRWRRYSFPTGYAAGSTVFWGFNLLVHGHGPQEEATMRRSSSVIRAVDGRAHALVPRVPRRPAHS